MENCANKNPGHVSVRYLEPANDPPSIYPVAGGILLGAPFRTSFEFRKADIARKRCRGLDQLLRKFGAAVCVVLRREPQFVLKPLSVLQEPSRIFLPGGVTPVSLSIAAVQSPLPMEIASPFSGKVKSPVAASLIGVRKIGRRRHREAAEPLWRSIQRFRGLPLDYFASLGSGSWQCASRTPAGLVSCP